MRGTPQMNPSNAISGRTYELRLSTKWFVPYRLAPGLVWYAKETFFQLVGILSAAGLIWPVGSLCGGEKTRKTIR